jgi:hypothetical protein
MFNTVDLTNRAKSYEIVTKNTTPGDDNEKVSSSYFSPPLSISLQIEKPTFDSVLCPSKGTICNFDFNTNARAAQNYNNVEDLAQAPCTMLTLKVL